MTWWQYLWLSVVTAWVLIILIDYESRFDKKHKDDLR